MATEEISQEKAEQQQKRRTSDAIFWGGVFIWAGIVFLAENLDRLPNIGTAGEWWFWIPLGAGVLALVINVIRLVTPAWSIPTTGDYIWTAVMLFAGIGGAYDFDIDGTVIPAVAFVAVGILILGSVFLRRE